VTITYGYAASSGGVRICYTTAPGEGVPVFHILNAFYPCGSVLAFFSGALRLLSGLGDGGGWYTFDWRGSGQSTGESRGVTFSDLVDDLEAVARAIGEPFDVSAVNDGCGIALGLAARRPEMVRRMLLIAPQGRYALMPEGQERSQRLADADRVGSLAQYLMWVHPGTDPLETLQLATRAVAAKSVEAVRAHRKAAIDVDLLGLAQKVTAPTFLISTGLEVQDALDLAAVMPFARAANWTDIGDGTINGAAWRTAWDAAIPPASLGESPTAAGQSGSLGLSPRELEILALICRGLSNAEIAEALVIAPGTAKRHVANVFAKLGVSSRPQAIALAYDEGLIRTPGPTATPPPPGRPADR
jgi:DNA-binding CsgD family transcriptional regulator